MIRKATAHWEGNLKDGKGRLDTQSGTLKQTPYSFKARFEDESGRSGTNPEELLGAAHAGCFTMQLSHLLAENGTPAKSLETVASVDVQSAGEGFAIKVSALRLTAEVPDISESDFQSLAQKAKEGCPLSKALKGVDISLEAHLKS